MSHQESIPSNDASRRSFLKSTSVAATAGVLASNLSRSVHAGEDNTIRVALVGCGGRGSGAAANCLTVNNGPIELVAMADVFDYKLKSCYESLNKQFPDKVKVSPDKQFVSFDAYKKAMDCLRPGDVVVMATPCAFRWVQFEYAISKGLNVFMEKPVTADGPSSRKMLNLAKLSVAKGLKVGVGLMCRHCEARHELFRRIKGGEIGDIMLMRAYRMAGETGSAATQKKPEDMSELMYQINRFHAFLWASGGAVSDFLIHNIDECCWMKDAWPVKAIASGGRHYRNDCVDQNFDTYSIEYTFEDGAKLMVNGRTIPGCKDEFASYAHGTKGAAVISTSSHSPAKCKIYSGQSFAKANLQWQFPQPEKSPYQLEWDHLIAAIRDNEPYNEVERGVQASVVTSMGRMAAHTGVEVTYDQMLNCEHEFAPGIENMTYNSPAPVLADKNGKYPVPQPGIDTVREYGEKT